ncbi:uncharacterized protein LOC134439658 [Engraulis encrasicolus]|uniref:uncharacterized protein LOC134439658 n=1 Tax=Engraulis encrasicolus TaxID=184585 RepID=UPI002FD1222B
MKQHEGKYRWAYPQIPGQSFFDKELILKDCAVHKDVDYGAELNLAVPKDAALLQFSPSGSKDQKILWSRVNMDDTRGARGTVSRNSWAAFNTHFADAGRYTVLRQSGSEISSTVVKVREAKRSRTLDVNSTWEDRVPVPVSEAVVTFIKVQKKQHAMKKQHVIFENGMMTEDALRIFEGRLSINTELDVLQFVMSGADSKTFGRYEVTEKKGRAFVIVLSGSSSDEPLTIPDRTVPMVVAGCLLILSICYCVSQRCCKRKEVTPAPPTADPSSAAADPAVRKGRKKRKQPLFPAPAPSPALAAGPAPPVFIHGPVPMPQPVYQPGHYDASTARGPQPYIPYVPYVPYQPAEGKIGAYGVPVIPAPSAPGYQYQPSGWSTTDILNTSPLSMATTDTRGPTGAYGVPVIPSPAAPSAPSPPDYQYQPSRWSGMTSDFLSCSPLSTATAESKAAAGADAASDATPAPTSDATPTPTPAPAPAYAPAPVAASPIVVTPAAPSAHYQSSGARQAAEIVLDVAEIASAFFED